MLLALLVGFLFLVSRPSQIFTLCACALQNAYVQRRGIGNAYVRRLECLRMTMCGICVHPPYFRPTQIVAEPQLFAAALQEVHAARGMPIMLGKPAIEVADTIVELHELYLQVRGAWAFM